METYHDIPVFDPHQLQNQQESTESNITDISSSSPSSLSSPPPILPASIEIIENIGDVANRTSTTMEHQLLEHPSSPIHSFSDKESMLQPTTTTTIITEEEEHILTQPTKTNQKEGRVSYPSSFKLNVIDSAVKTSVGEAAKLYKISHTMVSRWVRRKSNFEKSKPECRRIGSGRKKKGWESNDLENNSSDQNNNDNNNIPTTDAMATESSTSPSMISPDYSSTPHPILSQELIPVDHPSSIELATPVPDITTSESTIVNESDIQDHEEIIPIDKSIITSEALAHVVDNSATAAEWEYIMKESRRNLDELNKSEFLAH